MQMNNCVFLLIAIFISFKANAQTDSANTYQSKATFRLVGAPTNVKPSKHLTLITLEGVLYTLNVKAIKRKRLDTSMIDKIHVLRSDQLPEKQKSRLSQIIITLKNNLPENSLSKLKPFLKPAPL